MNTRILSLLFFAVSFVRAQEPSGLGELPHWPVGFKWPKELVESWQDKRSLGLLKAKEADVLAWTPPGAERIRAVLLIANNTDLVKIGEHKALRDMAVRREMGILYLRGFSGNIIEFIQEPAHAEESFRVLLDLAAEKTGIAEFRHAPWVTLGKSSRGRFPFQSTWAYPDRVIASISYHGEVPTWPMAAWSKAGGEESPLHLNIQGLTEWDGTWYRHVRPGLLNYHRHTRWLAHQLVIYGVDHGYYMDYFLYPNHGANLEKEHKFTRVTQVWDYISLFLDTAIELKVDTSAYPTEGLVPLKPVGREGGYLIHPRAPEELMGTKWFAMRRNEAGDYLTIPWPEDPTPVWDTEQGRLAFDQIVRPADAVPEAERAGYLWIPNRKVLEAWLGLMDPHKQAERILKTLPPAP